MSFMRSVDLFRLINKDHFWQVSLVVFIDKWSLLGGFFVLFNTSMVVSECGLLLSELHSTDKFKQVHVLTDIFKNIQWLQVIQINQLIIKSSTKTSVTVI